jgi:hypothetical protein
VHGGACHVSVAKISVSDRWTSKIDPSLHALVDGAIGSVDDPDIMIRQRAAAGDKAEGSRIAG